jgi:hypothetical protein
LRLTTGINGSERIKTCIASEVDPTDIIKNFHNGAEPAHEL